VKLLRAVVIMGLAAVAGASATRPLLAQAGIPQRLAAAKQHIVNLNADSAAPLLQSVIDPSSGADGFQRAWAYSLLALVHLANQDRMGAGQLFQQSFRTHPRLALDSLAVLRELDSQAEVVLQEARTVVLGAAPGAAVAPRDPLRVEFTARDSILAGTDSLYTVIPRPSRLARTMVTVAAVGAPTGSIQAFSDTLAPGAAGPLTIALRRADGRPVLQPGNYVFSLQAVDTFNMTGRVQWTMRLDTLAPVVQPLPPPLAASALRPETLQVKSRSPGSLVAGIGLGAVAAVLPTALGQSKLNAGLSGDGTAYLVAGAAAVAGVVGFLGGTRAQFQPANAQYNERIRREYEQRVEAVRTANEQARQRPRIRVTIVRETNP
jgi:hypothetical protein